MKLIKKHQFGGLMESLSNLLKPKYSIDERPTGSTPPAPGWTKMELLEPDVSTKPKVQLSKPRISNTVQTDALSVNNNIVTPIPKSIFTPYNKFLYDAIFTDADGKPYEYKEVNTNTFNKRFLSPQEASDFQDKKRNQQKQNDFRYALRSQISKHQPGGKVLPTAPPAEKRYAGGKRVINYGKEFNDSVSIRGVEAQSPWYKHPAQIIERIVHSSIDPAFNDTVYAERPSFIRPVNGVIRAAGNNYYFGKKQRYSLPIFGGFFQNNYEASTPEEQQEYDTLKRRFNTAWKVSKRQKGGNIERVDNTKVQHIPNNGEAVYEKTPVGLGDFLPLVGTYRAAQRIDKGEPNASYGDLIANGAMDLLGAGMVGPVVKAAGKANKIHKALKSRGFTQITKEPTHWVRTPKYVTTGLGNKLYSWQVPFTEAAGKVIPNVDYTNVAMQPLIQSLRVPVTAPFK